MDRKRGKQLTLALKVGAYDVVADSNQYTLRRQGKTIGYFSTLEGALLRIIREAPKTRVSKTAQEVIEVIHDAEKKITLALSKANIRRRRAQT